MNDMLNMLQQQAKALDELKTEMAASDRFSLAKSASSQSVDSSQRTFEAPGLLSAKALPTVAEPLPLLEHPPPPQDADLPEPQEESYNNDGHGSKSLEDYENEAQEMLSKKKAKVLDEKITVLKKPASKNASKAEPKGKATQKSKNMVKEKQKYVTTAFSKGIYGCSRCRGSTNGCSVCWSPYFPGIRFASREEYNKWYLKQQQSKKQRK